MSHRDWLTAAEASGVLGVKRATLYAYVSRGYLRSRSAPGSPRERLYARADVEQLKRGIEDRRDPDKAAARALQWGMPILESALTFIDADHNAVFYRGHDAVLLSRTRSLQEVASLLWTGRFETTFPAAPPAGARFDAGILDDLPFIARAQSLLARASMLDSLAYDLRAEAVARCGWRILRLLARAATRRAPGAGPIEETLARAWGVAGHGVDVVRAALILSADHELNVSAFTARTVASAGSSPYAVVIAGLAALEGTRHGGLSARVEAMLASIGEARSLKAAVAARLRRGESIDGFGHPLYRHGDPRAIALLDLLARRYRSSAELAFVSRVAQAADSVIGEKPTIDFALAALARVLRLPAGSPLTLFAIGRTIGWIGHAIEQYATGQLIRPRAKYVGPSPGQM